MLQPYNQQRESVFVAFPLHNNYFIGISSQQPMCHKGIYEE